MAITLHYFDIRGFGEYIRLFLKDQNIEFTDHRFAYKGDEWEELKKTMKFGQVPCLEIGDKKYAQTGAIMRHLGRIHGLNGKTEEDATFLDMFFEGVRDCRMKYVYMIYMDLETRENCINVTLPAALKNFECLLKTYENGDKYILGNDISYADYMLFEELDVYTVLDANILDQFPKLKAYHQRMWNRPNLNAYLEKRAADKVQINAIPKQ